MRLVNIEACATHVPGEAIATDTMLAALGERFSPGLMQSVQNIGIQSRHSVLEDYVGYLQGRSHRVLQSSTTDMAVTVSERCFAEWDGAPRDIGLVIAITNMPDRPMPCLGYELMDRLRGRVDSSVPMFNLQYMGCSAFLKAVELVQMFLAQQPRKKVLVVVAEGLTPYATPTGCHHLSFSELRTLKETRERQAPQIATQRCLYAMLFGDAAAAFVMGVPTERPGLGFGPVTHATNLGENDMETLTMNEGGVLDPAPGQTPLYWMGNHVGDIGIRHVKEALARQDALTSIDGHAQPPRHHAFFHVHTGSRKIVEGVFRALGEERADAADESLEVLSKHGNVGACSVALMAAKRFASGEIGNGLVISFGMGFSASVALAGTD